MVFVRCDEIFVNDRQTLQHWLLEKRQPSIKKCYPNGPEGTVQFQLNDESGNEISIGPSSMSQVGLGQLGCKTQDQAVQVFERCCATFSHDRKSLNFEFVGLTYEMRLSIEHFPTKLFLQNIGTTTEIEFGSAKEALDEVDEEDPSDSIYSHIPIKINKQVKYVDLRDVTDEFVKALNLFIELRALKPISLESYFRSLTIWMDHQGGLPFRRENDTTLLLPVPPAYDIIFKECYFSSKDLYCGDVIRPSTQFGHWTLDNDEDGEGLNICMAYRGQPFVYDWSQKRTRRLILWKDLKKGPFDRILKECGWSLNQLSAFTKSFRTCFRFTRCMVSFRENKKMWSMMVPVAMEIARNK